MIIDMGTSVLENPVASTFIRNTSNYIPGHMASNKTTYKDQKNDNLKIQMILNNTVEKVTFLTLLL
jgi:hypothetical protein